jgi:hypothetical protein
MSGEKGANLAPKDKVHVQGLGEPASSGQAASWRLFPKERELLSHLIGC